MDATEATTTDMATNKRKFLKGQKALSNDAKDSSGRAFAVVVIAGPYDGASNAYMTLIVDEQQVKPQTMNWYYEHELTLYCTNIESGKKLLKQYAKEND